MLLVRMLFGLFVCVFGWVVGCLFIQFVYMFCLYAGGLCGVGRACVVFDFWVSSCGVWLSASVSGGFCGR